MAVSFAEHESKKVLSENWECRSLRSQESRPRNQDSSRKTVIVKDTSSKAMVAIDGAGFDWSYMADDEVPTNMAFMVFSDSENEVVFYDQIVVLKRDASFRESEIIALNLQLEKLKKEKESNRIKINNFENASKSLDKLIGSQITNNSKTGLGFTSYNAIAPPPTGLFAPPTIDLSSFGLEEFKQPKFKSYGPKASKSVCVDTSNIIKKAFDAPIIEDWVSDCDEDESEEMMVYKHVLKIVEKETGQREVRPIWNNAMRVNHQNFSNSRRNFAPTAVLTKSGIAPISTTRKSSSRATALDSTATPINIATPKPIVNGAKTRHNAFQKTHSLSRRPFHQQTALKNRYLVNTAKVKSVNTVNTAKGKSVTSALGNKGPMLLSPQHAGFGDLKLSGCSRHMTENKSFLSDYQEYDGGFIAFASSSKGGKITSKGKIRTEKLDFKDVYFVKELKFNLFSVSQMCDKKNSVLFTETECLILSSDFKLPDENQVLLKVPRKNNMYSFDLKDVVPSKGLTCLFEKATNDESNLWHRRLGHINFKTMNKLVKGNLVRGLLLNIFENDHTCVACQKGKQHKASCKSKLVNSVSQPLQILHMNLFGQTFIKSIMGKMYCLVVIDDYSRCDNKTEFKNYEMNQFCWIKEIKREFSNARTPKQNKVAKRKNRTLIEAAKTMLAGSLLPIPFWAEAVNTACYVHNRVLVTKPHNKTPYELLIGREPIISFMRPFGCPVTILNTLDHLGKFDGKAKEGLLVGYSINSKAFRVYNSRTKKVEENLHVNFLENKPNVAGCGPEWLFDIDSLTNSMNYQPVSVGNRTNRIAGSKIHSDAGQEGKEKVSDQEYILLPVLNTSSDVPSSNEEFVSSPKDDAGKKSTVEPTCVEGDNIDDQGCLDQQMKSTDDSENTNSANSFNTTSPTVNTASDKDRTFQRTYGL
nr:hypothetical protein [Tanacetum cinerariifolium]